MIKPGLRSLENIHIPLWILKDICWFNQWKVAGIIISIPTLVVSIILCVFTKNHKLVFLPNLAVLFWLLANISWMYFEFFKIDFLWVPITFFVIGLCTMTVYYFPKKKIDY
ncbi:MAG: hypothetical protein SFY32_16170 [Bacteroidota bacterium]|nr:hypothetical protein [Bacteroidota bacterium]